MKIFLKWGLLSLVAIFGLIVIVGGIAGFWIFSGIKEAMVPQPSPPGTPNIDSYKSAGLTPIETALKKPAVVNWSTLPQTKPWTRWWWPGGDVNAAAASRQLGVLHDAGFGGVEIQPFNAGLIELEEQSSKDSINSFGSKAYYKTLTAVMDKAGHLDMIVDLNHLSGWPAGGPQVRLEDGLQSYAYQELSVSGGRLIEVDLPSPSPGINAYIMAVGEYMTGMDLMNFAGEHSNLVSVIAAKVKSGERTSNPFDLSDTIVLEPSSVQVITELVKGKRLLWQAPAGEWQLIFVYRLPAGQAPVLVAAEQSGFVIDHFDEEKLEGHYNFGYGSQTGLDQHYGKAFHGFFNDSLEFQVDRLTARDMLEQFKLRRGYDLEPFLPVVFIEAFDNFYLRDVAGLEAAPAFKLGEYDDRIRYDYQKTLSDLLIERFVKASANWAAQRGLKSRGQTYGVTVDTIRALGANDIPETEQLFAGGSELFMKLAYSGAALYQKPIVTAESFVWKKKAYAITPSLMKTAADTLFIAGVNQIIYHGVPYISEQPEYQQAYGDIGWYPFAGPKNDSLYSNNYGPRSPLWKSIKQLNGYISRAQGLLQQGKPAVDLYIYYPYHGFPHSLDKSEIARRGFLFDGAMPGEPTEKLASAFSIPGLPAAKEKDPRLVWIESIMPLIDSLNEKGMGWTWVNDDAIVQQSAALKSKAGAKVLIANAGAMPLETMTALRQLNESDANLLFYGTLPQQQPGFLNAEKNDLLIRSNIKQLAANFTVRSGQQLIEQLSSTVVSTGSTKLRRTSRRLKNGGSIHFLVNQSLTEISAKIDAAGKTLAWFDPITDKLWRASPQSLNELGLAPLESRFLLIDIPGLVTGTVPAYASNLLESQVLEADSWTLKYAGKNIPLKSNAKQQLSDWRSIDTLKYASQVGIYHSKLEIEKLAATTVYMLELGRVEGIATLKVNGQEVTELLPGPYRADISKLLKLGENNIEVSILPPRWNGLMGRFLEGDPLAAQMKGQNGKLIPVGLKGPVRLKQYMDKVVPK